MICTGQVFRDIPDDQQSVGERAVLALTQDIRYWLGRKRWDWEGRVQFDSSKAS